MKKQNKNTKSAKNTKGPGRPKYEPVFPRKSKWTFDDLLSVNNDGGKRVTPLTLRKFLKADMYTEKGNTRSNSQVVLVKGEFAEPKNGSGLGRKRLLYTLRDKSSLKTVKVSNPNTNVSVNVGTSTSETPAVEKSAISPETEAYEKQKAALLAPATPVTITPVEVIENAPQTIEIKSEVVSITTPAAPEAPVVTPDVAKEPLPA